MRFAGWRLRLTRPTGCAICRVAAASDPAYGLWVLPGGGYALPGLRDVRFAGWRLRLTRPTGCAFRRVAATPYPAYGLWVLSGAAASDLACGMGFCRPGKRSATGRFYRGRRMAQREPYAKPCAVSSSRFWRSSGVSVVIISNPNRL